MLRHRIITALVAAPLIIAVIIQPNSYVFKIFSGVAVLIAGWEWSRLTGIKNYPGKISYLAVLLVLMLLLDSYRALQNSIIIAGVCWWVIAVAGIVYLDRWRPILQIKPVNLITGTLVFISAWLSMVRLHDDFDYGLPVLLFLFLLVWTADTGAYFCGRRWGRKKLASMISPGKTWEGVYGALVFCVLLTIVYALFLDLDIVQLLLLLLVTILTVSISIVGDLTESIFKRNAGFKDSGNILPGHGGVLDRIDSLVAAAPVFICGMWTLEYLT